MHKVQDGNSCVVNFADDTNLLACGKDFPSTLRKVEDLMCRTNIWFNNNKLVLNKDKTVAVTFQTKQNLELPNVIQVGDTDMRLSKSTRFLGIEIDSTLSWKDHVEYLSKKLNTVHYSIRVLKTYLDKKQLLMIYHANFHSLLRYGIIFWGQSTEINRIFILQKNILRTNFDLSSGSHAGEFSGTTISLQ